MDVSRFKSQTRKTQNTERILELLSMSPESSASQSPQEPCFWLEELGFAASVITLKKTMTQKLSHTSCFEKELAIILTGKFPIPKADHASAQIWCKTVF